MNELQTFLNCLHNDYKREMKDFLKKWGLKELNRNKYTFFENVKGEINYFNSINLKLNFINFCVDNKLIYVDNNYINEYIYTNGYNDAYDIIDLIARYHLDLYLNEIFSEMVITVLAELNPPKKWVERLK